VRYADEYKTYIDQLFHATTLDRNQLLRCALFSAAHSKEFHQIISHFKKKDVSTPLPVWPIDDWRWWKVQDIEKLHGGMDVNVINNRKSDDEKDSPTHDPGGKINRDGNESVQGAQLPRPTSGRTGAVAAERGRDVIRGNGGGITIRIK